MASHSFLLVLALAFVFFAMSMANDSPSDPSASNPKKEEWEKNRLVKEGRLQNWQVNRMRLLRQEIKDNGCETNLCFALDASYNVTNDEFQYQKDFVDLIVAITTTDESGNYCATVYDERSKLISILTSQKEDFLGYVHSTEGTFQSYSPSAIRGIAHPIKQMLRQGDDANSVILFSKNKPSSFKVPHYFVEFVRDGNAITAVTFNINNSPDLAKITGDINRVVPADGFFDIAEIVIAVVSDICTAKCNTLPSWRKPEHFTRRGRGYCPTRLGEKKFKNYRGIGGVGVGFGDETTESTTPKKPRK